MATKKNTGNYSASSLQTLEGLDAVRKRPAMYIGSTDQRGLTHCVFEIFDNAVDEALAGHCDLVQVVAHSDGSVTVGDNGRGIPVDIEPKSKLPGVVLVMTKLHAGGKFGGEGYKVSGGLHGVGASVVNALSERMSIEIDRNGGTYAIDFQRAVSGRFVKDVFTKGTSVDHFIKRGVKTTGTRVRFWPDFRIFQKGAEIEWDRVKARLEQTSYLIPGLRITLLDEATGETFEYHHKGGIVEMLGEMDKNPPVAGPWKVSGRGSYTETSQVIEGEELVSRDLEREIEVEIALQWSKGYEYGIKSFVNIVETPKGGTHVQGFERACVKAVSQALSQTKLLKNDGNVTKEDIFEGLSVIVSVKLPEPQFEGQTKEVLGTSFATAIVSSMVTEQLLSLFLVSKNKSSARALFEKVAEATKARMAAKAQRDLVRRKSALESSALPTKLKDCRSHDLARSELLIIEGDSAGGTVSAARNSEYQAYLPIRGKILNVLRASERKMLDNEECAALITAIGAGAGKSFDIEKARYSKIVVLADADVDGSHIRCLLLTLCWRYMRPLLEGGRVYAAVPPLYRVTLKGSGEYIYCYSEQDKDRTLMQLKKDGREWRDDIQRYKGLGEMDADQLAETTLDVGTRRLRRMTVNDAAAAEKLFEILMGQDVSERRDYIVEQSNGFDRSRLDV